MANEMSIMISGGNSSGKSAVAELIRQTLQQQGIVATLNDDNGIGIVDEVPGLIGATLTERLGAVAHQAVVVSIRTTLTRQVDPCLTMV